MIEVYIIAGIGVAWGGITTGLLIGMNKLLTAAEKRASEWEERAGEIARREVNATLYASVALPPLPDVAEGYWQSDPTGLVREWIPGPRKPLDVE